MRHPVALFTVGFLVVVSGSCQRYPTQRREIAVEVHEGSNISFDLSPDGQWIVVDLVGQLWKLPAGGGEAVALTDAVQDSAEAREPRWSPDGTRVVFWRGFEPEFTYGVRPLWMLETDSGGTRALVNDTVRFIDPAWHPSGQALLVVHSSSRIRPDDRLYLYDLSTGTLSPALADGLPANAARRLAAPAWSPDGRAIAVVDGGSLGAIWEVDVASGTAVRITPAGVQAQRPVYAPDGSSIAYVEQDVDGNAEIWVQDRGGGARRQITAATAGEEDPTGPVGRVAWTPDGHRLVFVRSGRLWSVPRGGGVPAEIPFTATVRFTQERPALPPLGFPAPGTEHRARGFTGIALAPEGGRIALIALDSLWLVTVDGKATSITGVHENAKGISWSPDGRTLAWSGGPRGEEDVFATDIATGATRALTALPGLELRPAWSPDGQRVAFLHTGAEIRGAETHLRVLATDLAPVDRVDKAMDLGTAPGAYGRTPLDLVPQWSGDGSSVLLAQPGGEVLRVPLEGSRSTLHVPPAASSFRLMGQDTVVFLLEDQLYVAHLRSDSIAVEDARRMTDDAALYPAVSREGSVLYVSDDGLRVRRPNGSTVRLGWPIRYRTATSGSLVIRNARLVDGQSGANEVSDIDIVDGRIQSITLAGSVPVAAGAEVVDAEGRFVIPGLIELHQHPGTEAQLRGLLYFGVTTVRDMGNPVSLVAAWRDAVACGAIPGPRIVVAGLLFYPGCVPSGGAWCQFTEYEQSPSDDSAAARGLALAQAFGTGVVKMYSPGTLSAGRRFIEMAHGLGLPVTGHSGNDLPLVASGMDGEEHGHNLSVPALARVAGLVITPTPALVASARAFMSDPTILTRPDFTAFTDPADLRWYSGSPFVASWIPETDRMIRDERDRVRRFHDAGVILGAGTDIVAPPWALHTALEELVASGLTPAEALAAATSTAARVLQAEEDLGAISPGRIADLVILEADPFTDIRNTRKIWRVIQGGRVVDRETLLRGNRD